jgi:hypothetical protein
VTADDFYTWERGTLDVDQGHVLGPYTLAELGEEVFLVIVTPTCDFHQSKAIDYIVALPLLPFETVVGSFAAKARVAWEPKVGQAVFKDAAEKKAKFADFKQQFHRLIQGDISHLHYLPPLPGLGATVVWFTAAISLKLQEAKGLTFRAALRSPFREHLSTRFSAHFLRVGTTDFPKTYAGDMAEKYSRLSVGS